MHLPERPSEGAPGAVEPGAVNPGVVNPGVVGPETVSPGYPGAQPIERPTFYIPMAKPVVSRVILGVLLAMFFVQVIYGIVVYDSWMTFNDADIRALVDLGAKVNQLIAQGQIWRLFTATLLHNGIIHLMFNLYALFALGPMLEAYIGWRRFLIIYLLGGLFGSLMSYAFSQSISVGASGAIFGIIGATTVYFFRYRDNFGAQGRAILQNMIVVIVINLIFGFTAGYIDNFGHIGGLLGGALVTVGLMPRYEPPAVVRYGPQSMVEVKRRPREILWVLFCTLLFVGGVLLVNMRYLNTLSGVVF